MRGQLPQPLTGTIFDQGQALRGPRFVGFEYFRGDEFEDRRFHRVDRSEHPGDRARGLLDRAAAGPHNARRDGARSHPSQTGPGRLPHRSGSDRTDAAPDARAPSTRGTKPGAPRRVAPLPPAPSPQRTRVSRANPLPPSGERSKAVMVIAMGGGSYLLIF